MYLFTLDTNLCAFLIKPSQDNYAFFSLVAITVIFSSLGIKRLFKDLTAP